MCPGEGKITAQKEVALGQEAMLSGKMGVCGMHLSKAMHAGMAKPPAISDVKVPKATGADARTVAEIVTRRAAAQGDIAQRALQVEHQLQRPLRPLLVLQGMEPSVAGERGGAARAMAGATCQRSSPPVRSHRRKWESEQPGEMK